VTHARCQLTSYRRRTFSKSCSNSRAGDVWIVALDDFVFSFIIALLASSPPLVTLLCGDVLIDYMHAIHKPYHIIGRSSFNCGCFIFAVVRCILRWDTRWVETVLLRWCNCKTRVGGRCLINCLEDAEWRDRPLAIDAEARSRWGPLGGTERERCKMTTTLSQSLLFADRLGGGCCDEWSFAKR